MELASFEVHPAPALWLPGDEALILPLGDIQYGVEACDVDRLQRHIDWAMARPNTYFIGMGDYFDFASPSNRGRLGAALKEGALYDSVRDHIDEMAGRKLEQLDALLAPTRGRWLGLLQGHHYWDFGDGTTSDIRLAQSLGARFLGDSALVEVRFPATRKQGVPTFTIFAHHGRGSGRKPGCQVARASEVVPWVEADVYLIAHMHRKEAAKMPRMRAEFGHRGGKHRLTHRNQLLLGTGSFLRGYMAGSQRDGRAGGTYVEQGLMAPVALGGVVVWARPRWDREGRASVDLDASI